MSELPGKKSSLRRYRESAMSQLPMGWRYMYRAEGASQVSSSPLSCRNDLFTIHIRNVNHLDSANQKRRVVAAAVICAPPTGPKVVESNHCPSPAQCGSPRMSIETSEVNEIYANMLTPSTASVTTTDHEDVCARRPSAACTSQNPLSQWLQSFKPQVGPQ